MTRPAHAQAPTRPSQPASRPAATIPHTPSRTAAHTRGLAGFGAQSAALAPGGAVQAGLSLMAPGAKTPAAPSGINGTTSLGRPNATPGQLVDGVGNHVGIDAGKSRHVGVSDGWKATGNMTLGATMGDSHSWSEFDRELAQRGEGPRGPGAAYGQAEGFVGLQGQVGAEASTQNRYGFANAHAGLDYRAGIGGSATGYADASLESLAKNGKIGAGGKVEAEAVLYGVKAGAGARAGGGSAVGAIDPETGKRRDLFEAGAEVQGEAFIGARGGAAGEVYTTGLATGAAGRADAEVAARLSGEASADASMDVGGFTVAGVEVGGKAKSEARAGASAEGEAELSLTKGLYAKGGAEAEAMVRGEAQASGQTTLFGAHARSEVKGKAEAGAKAGAQGAIGMGPGSIGAAGSAKAFAGAAAEGTVGMGVGFLGVDVFTSSLTASVMAGAGAGVGGGFLVKDGVITINLEALAAAGIGAGLSGTITIDLLAPFKMVLRLLEVNGVLSSNPDEWLLQIIGGALDPEAWKKRMEGGHNRASESSAEFSATGGAGGKGKASGYAGDNTKASTGGFGAFGANNSATPPKQPVGAANAQTVADAQRDLTKAHNLSTEAGVESQKAVGDAMGAAMKGAANPAMMIKAIIQGAMSAIGNLIKTGVGAAIDLGKSIMSAASNAIGAIVRLIVDIIKAVLSGKKPDLSMGYDSQAAMLDQLFGKNIQAVKTQAEHIKTTRLAEAKNAVQGGLLELGTQFVAAAGGGLDKAQKKAKQAESLVQKVSARPVMAPDGSVTTVDPKGQSDVTGVSGLIGQMTGQTKAGKDTFSSAASSGASQVGTAKAGMDDAKAKLEPAMAQGYREPKQREDQKVAKKKQEGEAKWNAARGKKR